MWYDTNKILGEYGVGFIKSSMKVEIFPWLVNIWDKLQKFGRVIYTVHGLCMFDLKKQS